MSAEQIITPEIIRQLHGFTGFETTDGLFGYMDPGVIQEPSLAEGFFRATISYTPSIIMNGKVDGSGRPFHKVLFDNFAPLATMEHMRGVDITRLQSYSRKDPLTGERCLQIPTDHIKRIYNPHVRILSALVEKPATEGDRAIQDALRKAVFFLVDQGIPLSKIGTYGSLLVGLHNTNAPNGKLRDIDIVVRGNRFGALIMQLAYASNLNAPPELVLQHAKGKSEKMRRHHLSRIYIPGSDYYIDVRIVPDINEQSSVPRNLKTEDFEQGHEVCTSGEVIIPENMECEHISFPSIYFIKTDRGFVRVVGSSYNGIGLAKPGDVVIVKGFMIHPTGEIATIYLQDYSQHFFRNLTAERIFNSRSVSALQSRGAL